MKTFRIVFLLTLLLFGSSFAQMGPAIEHTPIATATSGQTLSIQLQTSLIASEITRAVIAYRISGEATYQEIEMSGFGKEYKGTIPSNAVTDAGLEYFLFLEKGDGSREVFPPSSGLVPENPFRVSVRSVGGASGVFFELISPEAGEALNVKDVNVISIAVVGGELDVATARLVLNDATITRFANVTPELISFIPKDLKTGANSISLSGKTTKGNDITTLQTTFKAVKVSESAVIQQPIQFQADAWSETRLEEIDQTGFGGKKESEWYQREQVQWRGRYGKLDFGGKVYFTNEEKKYEQPRNRYLIWLKMNWFKLGLGDNSPTYTPLTLSGKRVRGVEIGLHGRGAHLEFLSGYTDRSVEYYSTTPKFSFARELTAIRNWYGSEYGTRGGFTIVKTRDNRFSINKDSAKTHGVRPIENLVMSSDLQFAFDERRILLNTEVAWSLFNSDIGPGSVDKDSLKKLPGAPEAPIDPKDYEKYLVINQNLYPLDPRETTNIAYFTELQLNYFNNLFKFKYRNTGPAFTSMGSPFVVSDDKGISISDRIRLMDNRLYLTLGYETSENNLDENSSTGTVKNGAFNFDLGYYPTNVYLPDVSISYRGGDRKNDISDTTIAGIDNRVKETVSSTSIYLGKNFDWSGYNHNATLTMNSFDKKDKFNNRVGGSPYNAKSNLLSVSFQTAWDPTLKSTFTYSNLASENPIRISGQYVSKSTTYSSIGLKGDKSFYTNKLQTFLGFSMLNASGQLKFDKTMISLGSAYFFPAQFAVRLQADLSNSSFDVGGQSKTSSETFAFLRLEKKF